MRSLAAMGLHYLQSILVCCLVEDGNGCWWWEKEMMQGSSSFKIWNFFWYNSNNMSYKNGNGSMKAWSLSWAISIS